ncbi:MAG: hypothetical protein M1576_02120 [Deltaproteobacteria bacterium]|nr:hypothetical protein [Deltaproteobacteria bacterium]
MTASLSAYSLSNRNGVRFYLRNFPAHAGGMTPKMKFENNYNNSINNTQNEI